MTTNSSEILLRRFHDGSDAAAFEIHDRYRVRLIKLATRRLLGMLSTKVDPEDVSQEAFLAFFQIAKCGNVRWQKQGDLWRLLAGITINKVKRKFEFYGMAKRDVAVEEVAANSCSLSNAADSQAETELVDLVEHLLESEKPLMRTVLSMRLAGYSNVEIGDKIGRTSRTVRRLIDSLQAKIVASDEFSDTAVYGRVAKSPERFEGAELSVNDFQLLRMIGQGSFAKVYLAKEISSGSLFALKACQKKWAGNSRVWQTFAKENELLQRLEHPNIVRCFGTGLFPGGGRFLLLDFVDGVSFDEALNNSPDVVQLRKWLIQLVEAVEFIHSHKVSHGDLKAANVMVTKDRSVRILDFGLGKTNQNESGLTLDDRASDVEGLCRLFEKVADSQGGAFAESLGEVMKQIIKSDLAKAIDTLRNF